MDAATKYMVKLSEYSEVDVNGTINFNGLYTLLNSHYILSLLYYE
jgi:hypothetical protein